MTGSGSTAHCTVRTGPVVERWNRKRTKDGMPLCHGSISVPTCVCLSRRYAAEGANNRHRQASEIPVLGLAGGSKPSMSMALMYFLPES